MLNALDRALRRHQSARTASLPVLALGLWTETPDVAAEAVVTGATYRTAHGGHEVALDLDDPGGDGVSPVVSTVDVRNAELAAVILKQARPFHGAGLSMPIAPTEASGLDAELSGMTNRRHLLATLGGGGRQCEWHADARSIPAKLDTSHFADLVTIAVGGEPPAVVEDQPPVEGVITLWFLRAYDRLQRSGIKTAQVAALLPEGVARGTPEEVGAALARRADASQWDQLFEQFRDEHHEMARRLGLGGFSRLLAAATAQLYDRCKGPTVSYLDHVLAHAGAAPA